METSILSNVQVKDLARKSGVNGYPMIWNGTSFDFEHRVVWERANGKVSLDYVVHHINGIKSDNRLENLVAIPKNKHATNTVIKIFQERIRVLGEQLSLLKK